MNRKAVSGILLTLLFASVLTSAFSFASVIFTISAGTQSSLPVHNIDTCLNYSTIQEAINAPETLDGHTILADPGTYHENVVVNKSLTLVGKNRDTTIINAAGTGTVVRVRTIDVTITGFTVQNSERGEYGGIRVSRDKVNITHNIITNNSRGIWLSDSDENELSDNIIINNTYGVYLAYSGNSRLIANTLINNTYGIRLTDSSNNKIYHNRFINNTKQADPDTGSANTWDDRYPSGGNYWSNYTGLDEKSGPDQDQPGSDGIGDTSHVIDGNNKDNYPRLLTVHNDNTGLDYFWIQEAIDADETKDGHTIKVRTLMYYEQVKVDKSLTLEVENRTTAIIDGGGEGTVLHITARNVSISNFTIQNGEYGIHLDGSGDVVLRNNNMTNNNYNFYVRGTKLSHFLNDVDDSNWVDGKRIYYLINNQSLVIDNSTYPDLGYLGLVNCTNITAQNLDLTRNGQGLLLAFTNTSNITHVNASNNYYGIYLLDSSGNNVIGNNIDISSSAIVLKSSSNNTIIGNNLDISSSGVSLDFSSNNTIISNNITNISFGISLYRSSDNNVTDNNVANIGHDGVYLLLSLENTIASNHITNSSSYGISILGSSSNSVTDNNIVNNSLGIRLFLSPGNTIAGNIITNNLEGIYLDNDSSGNRITDNNIRENKLGINMSDSSNNDISSNDVTMNGFGIRLSSSSDNKIYHNSFIDNTNQTDVDESPNTWDDGHPSGGNYWSHYTSPDECYGPMHPQGYLGSDGLVDEILTINPTNKDRWPLTKPYGGQDDIGIESVLLSKTVFNYAEKEPYNLGITIKVINYGIHAETFNLTATINGTSIRSQTTRTLGYRTSTAIPFTWNTTDIAKGNHTIIVNITYIENETYTKDNTYKCNFTVSIKADINGDRVVDVSDLVLVCKKYYGCHSGLPDWNLPCCIRIIKQASNADINCDNKVDIVDLVLVIKYYGTADP